MATIGVEDAVLNARLAIIKMLGSESRIQGEQATTVNLKKHHEVVIDRNGIEETRLEVFDLNGALLFYDILFRRPDDSLVLVRAAADTSINVPVVSIGDYDENHSTGKLKDAAKLAIEKGWKIRGENRVFCYSYPKIGIVADDRNGRSFAIDLFDLNIVPLIETGIEGGPTENVGAFSFLQKLVWRNAHPPFNSWRAAEKATIQQLGSTSLTDIAKGTVIEQHLPDTVPLVGQANYYNCAPACAEMILRAMGFELNQTDIAKAMGTAPPGTSTEDQEKGIENVCERKVDAIMDFDPTFEEARDMLKGKIRAFKNGISNHARVTCGYAIVQTASGARENWIFIHDPWPINKGRSYWENWYVQLAVVLNHMYVEESQDEKTT